MFKIKTYNKISPKGLDLFGRGNYETASEIPSPDAIILRSYKLTPEEIDNSVKAIARAGAGVNNIPVDYCTEKGIVVFNTPGANANSVKELVIAGLLLSARKIHEGISWVENQGDENDLAKKVEKEKSNFAGTEINGKTLGVIGLGAIGVLVANAAVELGMNVYGYDPYISVKAAWSLSRKVNRIESLEQLISISDYVTLHVPLIPETENLIGKEILQKAKKGIKILNFARGGLVDTAAVKEALSEGTVSKFVTDFPVSELLGVEGVLAIPHLGASTAEAEENCAVMAANQLKAFLENGEIINSVNFPACSLERSEGARLAVANRNIPKMLSQILSVLADAKLNVENMVNRNKDGIAYNLIDLSAENVSSKVLEEIKNIDGVISVRLITD